MKLKTVNEIMLAARLAVNNAKKDDEVVKKLGQYGFPPRRMQEGENLLIAVQEMQQAKQNRYNERWKISNQLTQELQSLRPIFMEHVRAARFAFRHEPGVLHNFNIKSISTNTWTWVEQARNFYKLIGAYREEMASYRVAPEVLDQAKASVEAVLTLRDDRIFEKGKAEDCTQNRNQASKMLKDWVKEFHTSARLALKDTPQKLEAFGMSVPSLQK